MNSKTVENHKAENKMLKVILDECDKGLGMKIIGGLDPNGNYTGIFVKQILPDGVIDKNGLISLGDMICKVNEYDLRSCSQAEAISFLRVSTQSGQVELLVDNSQKARMLFLTLFERPFSPQQTPHTPSKLADSLMKITDEDVDQPKKESKTMMHHSPSVDSGFPGSSFTSQDMTFVHEHLKTVCIPHETSLGLCVAGGTDQNEGPNVFIQDIFPGGDVHSDGTLRIGDVIISINGETLVGVSNEQAKLTLSRIKFRNDIPSYQISYVPRENRAALRSPKRFLLPAVPVSPVTAPPMKTQPDSPATPPINNRKTAEDRLLEELHEIMDAIDDSENEEESSLSLSSANQQQQNYENLNNENDNVFTPKFISTPFRQQQQKQSTPPRNTISHYLRQDVPSLDTEEEEVVRKKIKRPSSRSLSLDAHTTIKLEKLEGALQHLGITPSLTQREEIRKRLKSDAFGSVSYGEFVQTAREVLQLNGLQDRSNSLKAKPLTFQKSVIEPDTSALPIASTTDEMTSYRDELYRLRRERDQALKDTQYYRDLLHDKDQDCINLEDELEQTRQQVAAFRRECNSLRFESEKAIESSHQQRRDIQSEQTIRRLEKENSVLRSASVDNRDTKDLQKRLVVIGCQLRKTEVSKRSYEVAVDKLTTFVEKVHLSLDDKHDTSSSRKARKSKELSLEAKDTVKNIKMLLEEEPLPFGWEEVYTPEGTRYYMNHVTQSTSWVHPISNVSRKPKKEKERKNLSVSSKGS